MGMNDGYRALDDLWGLVGRIPKGRCAAYGSLGRALQHPVSGYIVGRWMAQCPEGLPWWRVVAKDGRLPIHKRDPRWADEQRRLLEGEGIEVCDGKATIDVHGWDPAEAV